jgi:hypothetical protein
MVKFTANIYSLGKKMSKNKAFGSFHSENVEFMISDASWSPPADPPDVAVAEVD